MNRRTKHFKSNLFFLIIPFFLAACGGSDGGGGGSASLEYTGLKTQATIDADNAVDISISSFKGSSNSGPFTALGFPKREENEPTKISKSRFLLVSNVLKEATHHIQFHSSKAKLGVQHKTETLPPIKGECGGEVSITINIDEQTNVFDGVFNFNNFCKDNTIIAGSGDISGQVIDEDEGQFNFSFGSLTVTSGSDSFTFSGDINVNLDGSSNSLTMNILLKDNSTGKVFLVEDFNITLFEGSDAVEFSVSGRFFHPDEGFVDIQTENVFRITGNNDFPSTGSVVANGGDGTKARLVSVSSTTFQVTADTDGNGTDDFTSGELNWADF